MGPLDGVTHSRGNWGKDRSAHWLAHPVPWDFTRVELVGSWESLRGSLGGVSMSVRAGPFAGGAGLGHPEFHSSQTQVSQHRPEPRGASRRNWAWAGLEGRKLGGRACMSLPVGQSLQSWECFIITSQGNCPQPSPFVETRVCVWV